MIILFNYLLVFTIILLILKLVFSFFYFYKINNLEKTEIDERKYTIIQPILSGDPRLKDDLTANLKNTTDMRFIWLVDKSDKVAIQIVESILKNKNYSDRVEVYYLDDVPQEINPKIFKLSQVVEKIKTEYTIILDDDAVIDRKRLDELSVYEKDKTEWIATGIPFNYNIKGFYSKLISAFINSNSIFSYFSMSFLKENKTINGMFYILRTEILSKYNAFEEIKYWLCDDLALATYLLSKNIKIIQSTIFCNVRNTVPSFKRYTLLMKRWLLFGNVYMKSAFSIKFFFIILLPTLLPTILLFLSFYLGVNYLVIVLNLFIGKVALFHIVRLFIYQGKIEEQENFSKKPNFMFFSPQTMELLYELISEFLLPFMLIYTLLSPPVIIWRNKKIRVKDGKIHYEI
ncbi:MULTISPECIES: glycosyltransferase [Fusobacterium]|uniref:glycosyltransferase family 21 protein n=2 Tax=Fusobacteriaceae TaxID=203492 RepID=UPI00041668A1|nr:MULTISPECIES: glycosyltransferase [Fusobacterium]